MFSLGGKSLRARRLPGFEDEARVGSAAGELYSAPAEVGPEESDDKNSS
jgi:hypothetical protein